MSRFIVDASVAVKWFLPEIHDAAALRLLTGGHELHAPDLLFPQVGNILWKRVRKGDLTEEEADATLAALAALPIRIAPSWPLAALALPIACRTDRTVYDSLYLALAVREMAEMVTADERFYNALKNTPLASSLRWVEDIP